MTNKYVIIVAGGKGLRMGSDVPKQFLLLKNKPVLAHSIEAFYLADTSIQIIVVLPENQIDYWKELCIKHNFKIPHKTVIGGQERFHSVLHGLQHIKTGGYVAIHDGVRPLVSTKMILEGFQQAAIHNGVVPVIDSTDSLRKVSKNTNEHVDRKEYKRVQTPQVFNCKKIIEAYSVPYSPIFTDDASVFEHRFGKVSIFNGEERNIKITNSYDLAIAEIFLQ